MPLVNLIQSVAWYNPIAPDTLELVIGYQWNEKELSRYPWICNLLSYYNDRQNNCLGWRQERPGSGYYAIVVEPEDCQAHCRQLHYNIFI